MERRISVIDLEHILEVNKKAIAIQIETEKQNELILDNIYKLKEEVRENNTKINYLNTENKEHIRIIYELKDEIQEKISPKISGIDKAIFRLIVVLSGTFLGAIITIIQLLIGHH